MERLEDEEKQAYLSGRASPVEETACAKVLRCMCAWPGGQCGWSTVSEGERIDQRKKGLGQLGATVKPPHNAMSGMQGSQAYKILDFVIESR